MKRARRDVKIQVRIAPSEKDMLAKMGELDREFSISKLVRRAIHKEYSKYEEKLG